MDMLPYAVGVLVILGLLAALQKRASKQVEQIESRPTRSGLGCIGCAGFLLAGWLVFALFLYVCAANGLGL